MLIIANGFPRSGSTKLYNLLQEELRKRENFVDLGYMTEADLRERQDQIAKLLRKGQHALIKSHSITEEALADFRTVSDVRHYYTYRDLRQTVLSAQRVWHLDKNQVAKLLQENIPILEENLADPGCTSISYSCLVDEPIPTLRSIMADLSADLSDSQLIEALENQESVASNASLGRHKLLALLSFLLQTLKRIVPFASQLRSILTTRQLNYLRLLYLGINPRTALHPSHYAMKDYSKEEMAHAEALLNFAAPDWAQLDLGNGSFNG